MKEQLATFRDVFRLLGQVLARLGRGRWRWKETEQAIIQNGIGSVPIIVIATTFAGLVVTREIAWHMDQALHSVTMIPGFTAQFILRELGIAIPALLVVSKVGAATTAEVGSMKVTEQIDALKLLGIDPIDYLVVPRFVAALISGACLTLIASAVTLACAVVVSIYQYHFNLLEYINSMRHFIGIMDLVCALTKGLVYGGLVPLISCAYGFRCRGGAEGVGTATTNSVVAATIGIIVLDFGLTFLFSFLI